MAEFGGSWRFITLFFIAIVVWIAVNSIVLVFRPFDPFILLNLVPCLAAIRAPIVLMSQNLQEIRDRLRLENDCRVDLKAELEIRHLNDKLDHLLMHQWERLLETRQIQVEPMDELSRKSR